ncbi:hypothetical protein OBO34_19350 [Clostridiales Family XIII bacterium ASD5510]|uniref:Uncharacterized protein n=1 Tax=Hominibacterium faecale TaxID=2839743 RepID=A0A9J6QYD7_9FIRM|nr:hypothetical protein [Hominibacterium faecale]MCU7380472.1 hypothetical protein [Hominibacterium faecale]
MAKHYHCPVGGLDCPYWKSKEIIDGKTETCLCKIDGNPYRECDDFYSAYGDECSPEEYTEY